MTTTDLNRLERALCAWIGERTGDAALARQLAAASVRRRDYTRTGFFIFLDAPAASPACEGRKPVCPQISAPELPYGAGCNLFLRDGRLHYLEIYTRGGFMPEVLEHFELSNDS